MINYANFDKINLISMFEEVEQLRIKCEEYKQLFGYEDIRAIARRDIENDILKEIGRRIVLENRIAD